MFPNHLNKSLLHSFFLYTLTYSCYYWAWNWMLWTVYKTENSKYMLWAQNCVQGVYLHTLYFISILIYNHSL